MKTKRLNFGSRRMLSESQEIEILELITTKRPFQLKFEYEFGKPYLWTRGFVKQMIMNKYGLEISDAGLVKYLKRWGFPTLVKNVIKPGPNGENFRERLFKDRKDTLVRREFETSKIYWMGNSDILRLEGRKRTLITVADSRGRIEWMAVNGRFDGKAQVKLLKSMAGQARSKVFLINKKSTQFNNTLVTAWLINNNSEIEVLHFEDMATL